MVPNTVNILPYLIIISNPKYCYYPHFSNEETETQKGLVAWQGHTAREW